MTRVCVVGNSHAVAIKQGWEEIRDRHPDCQLTFFASGGTSMDAVTSKNGKLVAGSDQVRKNFHKTSGGRPHIDPKRYDAFVLVGMGVGLRTLLYCSLRYPLDTQALDIRAPGPDRYFVSADLLTEISRAMIEQTTAFRLLRALREITDRPIHLVAEPLPAEDIVTSARYDAALRDVFAQGHDQEIATIYEAVLEGLRRDGNPVVTQPGETRKTPSLTRREYNVGSHRIVGRAHEADDCMHMNARYGARMLEEVLGRIDRSAPPAAAGAPQAAAGAKRPRGGSIRRLVRKVLRHLPGAAPRRRRRRS